MLIIIILWIKTIVHAEYKYDLCGHVLTGDLSIIRDVKLRNLIRKGPVFREQNNIDWEVNLKNCKASVSKYVKKWARIASVDRQVLRDWELRDSA